MSAWNLYHKSAGFILLLPVKHGILWKNAAFDPDMGTVVFDAAKQVIRIDELGVDHFSGIFFDQYRSIASYANDHFIH
jgi:hypothetical protein